MNSEFSMDTIPPPTLIQNLLLEWMCIQPILITCYERSSLTLGYTQYKKQEITILLKRILNTLSKESSKWRDQKGRMSNT